MYISFMPKHHKTIYICSCKVNTNTIRNTTYWHICTHAQAHFQQQTQKWNHIVVFGKEKWNRNPGDHDNKGSNNLNHFMTLNEMEMVWLRNEFFHPIPATALHAKQVLLLLPTNSSNTQHYIIIWCTIELKKNLGLLSWYTCGAPWK